MARGRADLGVAAALRRSLRAAVGQDWDATETWLERAVEADSDDLQVYHALARLYRERGAIGRAIRMHQNLLLRSDLERAQRADALLELARDFDAGGFTERAAAAYEEILDAEPRHEEALERLAEAMLAQREYPRAQSLARRLRRRRPERAEALEREIGLAEARARYDEGDQDAARSALRRMLRRHKDCGPAWALLGRIESERGKDAKALDAWRRGVLADSGVGPEVYPLLDASFAARSKPADFEKLMRRILEERPTDAAARIALARFQASRGDTAEAIEELRRGIEVAPEDRTLRVALGRELLASGQEAEALKAYAGLLEVLERGDLLEESVGNAGAQQAGSEAGDASPEGHGG